MRLITPKLWNFKRVLHTLYATQEVPRHTRLHSRGTSSFPPPLKKIPVSPSSSRGDLTLFRQLNGAQRAPSTLEIKPRFPATTRAEPHGSQLIWRIGSIPCFNSRRNPTSSHTTRRGLSHQLNLEWNPADPAAMKKDIEFPIRSR